MKIVAIRRHLLEGLFIGSQLAVIALLIARRAGFTIGFRVRGNMFAEEFYGLSILDWVSIGFLALGLAVFLPLRWQPRL